MWAVLLFPPEILTPKYTFLMRKLSYLLNLARIFSSFNHFSPKKKIRNCKTFPKKVSTFRIISLRETKACEKSRHSTADPSPNIPCTDVNVTCLRRIEVFWSIASVLRWIGGECDKAFLEAVLDLDSGANDIHRYQSLLLARVSQIRHYTFSRLVPIHSKVGRVATGSISKTAVSLLLDRLDSEARPQ